jgi:hypothetical protein
MNSRNHIMYGSIGAWFWQSIAGINLNAFNPIIIAPNVPIQSHVLQLQNSTSASLDTIKGNIQIEWKVEQSSSLSSSSSSSTSTSTDLSFSMNLSLPPNTVSALYLPILSSKGGYFFVQVNNNNKH